MKLTKLTVNNQVTRDGWGSLVRDGDARVDVFIFSFNRDEGDGQSERHTTVIPVSGFCPHCQPGKYPVQLAFTEGCLPMYTCLCNRLDGKARDFDTIRYVDIFENQLVSILPLRHLQFKNENQTGSKTSVDG
jgi:hypothetical protein